MSKDKVIQLHLKSSALCFTVLARITAELKLRHYLEIQSVVVTSTERDTDECRLQRCAVCLTKRLKILSEAPLSEN